MEFIKISVDDIMACMDRTFLAAFKEFANEKYTPEKEQGLRTLLRKSIEETSNEAYIELICEKISDEILDSLRPEY